MKHLFIFFLLLICQIGQAQEDSLFVKDTEHPLVGKIKVLDQGVLTFKTSYSKSDFKIKWSKVLKMYTDTEFMIYISNGNKHIGYLRSQTDSTITIYGLDHEILEETTVNSVVSITRIKEDFWSRIKGNIDLGYNLSKSNNLSQLTFNTKISYKGENWNHAFNYAGLHSSQDSAANIDRNELILTTQRYWNEGLIAFSDLQLLSNTEQALDLRTSLQIGPGKLFVHTNKTIVGGIVGLNILNEQFSNEQEDKNSAEILLGGSLNLFDFEDLDLNFNFSAYPSLTEKNRFRFDSRATLKYDLPLDFYISANYTINYDNQPAIEGKDLDYIFQVGFGWEFNDD